MNFKQSRNFLIFCIILSLSGLGIAIMYAVNVHTLAFFIALGLSVVNLPVVIVCFVLFLRANRKMGQGNCAPSDAQDTHEDCEN